MLHSLRVLVCFCLLASSLFPFLSAKAFAQLVSSYDDFARALLAKVQTGGNPTEPELLMLITQPGEVA